MSNVDQATMQPPERPPRTVRVLIVDDSALMRRLLADLLGASAQIQVVGMARDGREAIDQAFKLKPDVITLDVEMPHVSGLQALPSILEAHEVPIVMVSALTQQGAEVTLQALELGAVDFMPKPERNQLAEMRSSGDLLIAKVLAAANSKVRRPRRRNRGQPRHAASTSDSTSTDTKAHRTSPNLPDHPVGCIGIGISTGGPQALNQIIPAFLPPLPPILIVQHMPAQFTGVFADRLNRASVLTVKEAEDGELVLADHIYVAPGGQHMTVIGRPSRPRIRLTDDPPQSGHKPSVDVLFDSIARLFQKNSIGIIMTGMGRDGVAGCKSILSAGGVTLGQDELTSVVYGMNKAAYQEQALKAQFSLDELPGILQRMATMHHEEASPGTDA